MGYLTNNVIDGLSDNGGFASKVAVLIGKMMFQSVGFRLIFHIKTHVNWALLRSWLCAGEDMHFRGSFSW